MSEIWLINPYGPIPEEGWRDYRFTLLGRALAARGHQVVWWTANFSHHFKKFRSEGWRDIAVNVGFTLRLVPTTGYAKNIGLGRLKFEVGFAKHVYAMAKGLPAPHCIVGTDPSQIVGRLARRLSARHRCRLILDVFDLWPELFVGAFPKALRWTAPLFLAPFYRARRTNWKAADGITALCKKYLEVALAETRDIAAKPTRVIYNGIDVEAFRRQGAGPAASAVLPEKPQGEYRLIHAGSLGNNYDIATLLAASKRFGDRGLPLSIVIAGDGPMREEVATWKAKYPLSKLLYLGKLNHADLAGVYAQCDVGLCPYAPFSNVGMPDKVYDYLAVGLPVLSSLRSELAEVISTEGIGRQYAAGDLDSFVESALAMTTDPTSLSQAAEASMRLGGTFDAVSQYRHFADFVEDVIAGQGVRA